MAREVRMPRSWGNALDNALGARMAEWVAGSVTASLVRALMAIAARLVLAGSRLTLLELEVSDPRLPWMPRLSDRHNRMALLCVVRR